VSWQSGSQQVAIIIAALIGYFLNKLLAPPTIADWGWRIPFFIGSLIVPFVFYIRRSLEETPEFLARKHRPTVSEVFWTMVKDWQIVIAGMLLVVMTTVSFYTITVYTPTYGNSVLHLGATDSLVVTLCVGISNLFWLPVMGALSDRIGRKPLLLTFTVVAILTVYPALRWLVAGPTFDKMLIVELWLSFLYGSYNGAMVVALTEVVPANVRTAGFSLAYSLATALFGGFTPAVATTLIELTGDKAAPGYWMSFAAVCSLLATLFLYRRGEAQPAPTWPEPDRARGVRVGQV
jgi:MFS transporter, MHS family, citrate/tricarballylate:H+ symporter